MAFTPTSSLAPVSVTVAGTVAVTGPLTDAQLRASVVPVDGSSVTQPISAAALPLPAGAAKDSTLTDSSQRVGGTVTVSGPLTDTQLRASAVPVSGPLTDAQLRATPVPISGTVSTGGLTDTQLRASPVPISGTVATGGLTNAELRAADVPVSQGAGGTAWAVVQATVPWLVDASGFPIPVTGPLTDAELRASELAISAASLPLPDGAATEATQVRAEGAIQDVALTAILEREKVGV